MGSGISDAEKIKSHPFFKSIDWKELNNLKRVPPFKPKIEGKDDLRHFDKVSKNKKMTINLFWKMFLDESVKLSPSFNEKKDDMWSGFTFSGY